MKKFIKCLIVTLIEFSLSSAAFGASLFNGIKAYESYCFNGWCNEAIGYLLLFGLMLTCGIEFILTFSNLFGKKN